MAQRYRVMFYNVENLFDTRDDPATLDDEFTPRGEKHWTRAKYESKLLHLSRAIAALGGDSLPALIGMAEVENRWVLLDLTTRTSLADGDYTFLHRDSPDERGIDVALLYRRQQFRLLDSAFLPVRLATGETSRDILYCKGILASLDTLHCFVCHFPSMRGGERATEWKRLAAAAILRQRVDSIRRLQPLAAILIMGDLNGKANRPAQQALGSRDPSRSPLLDTALYNTGYYLLRSSRGTYRYQGHWQTLDHIIVSGSLLTGTRPLRAEKRLTVFSANFLLQEDRSTFGSKPFRTYAGPRHLGGYSDHLPVYLDLFPHRP